MADFFRRMDWALNGAIAILISASLVAIASAKPGEFASQAVALAIGLCLMTLFAAIDWRSAGSHRSVALTFYGAGIALLVATYFFAPPIRGVKSWLVFEGMRFQTSEFMKLGLIVLYSYYFAKRHVGIAEWKNILIPGLYAAVPAVLVMIQPDMGSALIIVGIFIAYLFMSGIRWSHIFVGIGLFAATAAFGWGYLAEYQRDRVRGLFNPSRDPLGVNYNVIQSKIAIGSGGLVGKGWKQGTQTQLGFLPEAGNDFIIASIAEEWGLAGVLLVFGAFVVAVWRAIAIAMRARGNFGALVCLGFVAFLGLHIAFNVGSAAGFMPVVGVPLPFVSSGGSNLLTFFMILGILQSIAIRSVF